jgi:CRISPR type I-E-associated protein CasB/Cse2
VFCLCLPCLCPPKDKNEDEDKQDASNGAISLACSPPKDKDEDKLDGLSLGAALSHGERITDRRLFQALRSEPPHDMTQLRRLILFVGPTLDRKHTLDRIKAAKALWHWGDQGDHSRRNLLEDFILYQPTSDTSGTNNH